MLHEKHQVSLTLGYMWGITLLDFAAGKGHMRIIEYLIEKGALDLKDKPSLRDRITAVDRACKAGFVDVLDKLHELGANLKTVRLNRQTPAHGAAMLGHTDVLKRLHELGTDLEGSYDQFGKSPLDYAVYFCHKEAAELLRGVQDDRMTRWEETRLLTSVVKMQSLVRKNSAVRKADVIRAVAKKPKTELTEEQQKAMAFPGM